MADHLILSLHPLPCFPHRRWNFSRRFPSGIRFSIPQFRLSSQLVNSTSLSKSSSSPLPPPSSAPEKFELVSTTQLKDGSHVFRFGDASEIEKILETEKKLKKQQQAQIAEEAREVSRKQRRKDEHELADLDRVSELEEISDAKKKSVVSKEESVVSSSLSNVIKIKDRKRVRSPSKKKKVTSISVNLLRNEDYVEAKTASVSNLSSIEKEVVSGNSELINEDDVTAESYNAEPLSSEVMEEKKETLTSVNVSRSEGNVEAKVAIVSNMSSTEKEVVTGKSEPIHEDDVTTKSYIVEPLSSEVMEEKKEPSTLVNVLRSEDNVEAKTAIVSNLSSTEKEVVSGKSELINENDITAGSFNVEPISSEVMEEVSVNGIGDCEPNGSQQITENRMEVQARSSSSTSQHVSQSTIELDDSLDVRENPTKTSEAEDDLVIQPTVAAVVSPDEPISTSEPTHHSVENPVVDTSGVVNGEENAIPTIEDEVTVRDTKTDNGSISKAVNDTKGEDLQVLAPETAGLESSEVASGREVVVSKAFYLDSGFASLPSPVEALAGREDAYFISHNNWLGVADGVSQWSFKGINKGIYVQELMSNCEKIVSDETAKTLDPVQVLHRSVNASKSLGSSTALIAHLDNNELNIANIGDSGFMVIRNGTVLQRSSPMFHHFCFPLQITQGDDVPKLAEVYNVNLEEGDVVITATDGLYDNLYEEEIVSIVCLSLEQSLEPQKIAELVAAKAQEVGGSGRGRTPFVDAAKEEGYDGYKGGKLDAVTVIISLVKAEDDLVVQPTVTADVSPDEPISTSEITHHSVDKIGENPAVDTSEGVNDEDNSESTIEDEITVRDTTTENASISKAFNDTKGEDLQLPAPETVSIESSEVASGREELVSKAFYLDSGLASLPSPVEALAGREDAYFISNQNWLGIADGVSQWSFGGINKGTYAQDLMSNCEKIISDETAKTFDPVQVLHRSVDATKSLGSSTALIAHLDNNELHIANIGDSGFMVIRNGTVLQRSSPMFHHFCFPLQITKGDDALKLAEVYTVNLEEGDIVIAASDGLYDNLYEEEIVSIVCSSLEQGLEPQRIAELVAAKAQEVGGGSVKERTPFADAAKEEGYDGYKGGKLDDVTVIISLVKPVSA